MTAGRRGAARPRRRTAPHCDGTSVSSHRSRATCYPLPAKLCFLIKSIVKERLACIPYSPPFSAPISYSLLARRVTKESIVCPRVSTPGNRWLEAKTGSYPNLFGYPIAREASPTWSLFCSSSRRYRTFVSFPRTLDKFQIALGSP